jgi:hypothetical protein
VFSTTTAAQGVVPGSSGAAATSFLNATGAWSVPAGGGGAPGGSTTQVQYNNASAFGGISNVTTNGTALTELDINVSSSTSTFVLHGSAFTSTGINITSGGNVLIGGDGSGVIASIGVSGGLGVRGNSAANAAPAIVFTDSAGTPRGAASWWEVGVGNTSGIIEQRYTTVPQTYRVYNTTDTGATNYERGVMDWTTTANTLIVGTQAAGTGTARNLKLVAGGVGPTVSATSAFAFAAGSLQFLDGTGISWGGGGYGVYMNAASDGSLLRMYTNGNDTAAFNPVGLSLGANRLQFSASSFNNGGSDVSVSRTAAKVVQFGDGGGNANGWHQWAGEARATANTSITSSTTLVPVTGLTTNVQAGRTYGFQAELSGTWAAAGGVRAAIAGTATATNIVYDGWIVDSAANGIKGNAQSAALAGVVANAATTGTAGHVTISGTITVNAAGTLLVQAAQSVSNAGATVILQGSTFFVWDMP